LTYLGDLSGAVDSPVRSLLLVALVSFSLLLIVSPSPGHAQILQPHDPILITSNSAFTIENGVTPGGNGSYSNPFVIEDWEITVNTTAGIHIRNTQSFFVIRNVLIHPANFTQDSSGILLDNVANGRVENVRTANFANGISLFGSQNYITTSTAWNNTYGIIMTGSGNIISDNQLNNNTQNGIKVSSSTGNLFTGNNAANNENCLVPSERIVNPCDGEGFRIDSSSNNVFENNFALGNLYYGFRILFGSSGNIFRNNNVSRNSYGIVFTDTSGNQAFGNSITNNIMGIGLEGLNTNNNITMNRVINNGYGIYVFNSSRNIIYNNYLQNPVNTNDDTTQNAWNTTKTLKPNILGGPFLGGNFYSDYQGADPDGDGIGDTPYAIQGGPPGHQNQDYLPLVQNQPTTVQDIAVRSVNAQPASGRAGATIIVTANVFNQGTVSESFWVSVFYNQTIINHPPQSIANLPAWSGTTFSISWDTAGLTPGTYLLGANASIVTGETYTINNVSPPTPVNLTANQPPIARFTIITTTPLVEQAVALDASTSYDPDLGGSISSYTWNFGDSTPIATVTTATTTHAYSTSGLHTITLTVTDNEGAVSGPSIKSLTATSNQPGVPLNFQLTATSGKATLTWSPPSFGGGSPIVHYRIYRATSPSQPLTWLANTTDTSYVDTTVTNGQTFYYQVTAVNGAGIEGAQSPQQDVLIPGSGATGLSGSLALWLAVAAVIVVTIGLGVLMIRGRRTTGPVAA